ncbi:hypothetical protein GCM10010840_21080 [Deinococcus aerolatus]|uniref:DUF3293 domain-containing protein n=1 Tax=Deinococcus aerolatus TaxID=522487 RepID=A0ABQ2GA64_9DEIO|nr:DUF3293 domain-containing protein [Deinococcus aerolatus]GGL83099.1 hypothetical protein GCM10010840_21080 [Deinococcus aerolatus]
MREAQRAAFLAALYGTPRERFGLAAGSPGAAPSWAANRWAVVTAWNPGGRLQPRADNLRAGRELLDLIASRPHLPGVNGEGQWAEASVIVPGLHLREAAELGRRFGQAAVLFGVGRRVALVWLEAAGVCVERFWVRLLPD